MTYSDEWFRHRKLEDDFFTCRYNFMQDKKQMVKDLKIALMMADNETALRVLRDMKPSVEIKRNFVFPDITKSIGDGLLESEAVN